MLPSGTHRKISQNIAEHRKSESLPDPLKKEEEEEDAAGLLCSLCSLLALPLLRPIAYQI